MYLRANLHGRVIQDSACVFLRLVAWDSNCPQHILLRWTEDEIAPFVEILKAIVERLELENEWLRNR